MSFAREVELESEGLASTNPAEARTFMFTDMEGSTRMIERMGDRGAHRVFRAHDDIIRRHLAPFGAREVEQHGDGFLLAFGSAWRGLSFAVALQRAFAAYSRADPENSVRVRIGLHSGPAIRTGSGFFGKAVVVAARIAAEASGGEILGSDAVLEAAGALAGIVWGEPRTVELKGLSGAYRLHPVTWSEGIGGPVAERCARFGSKTILG